MADKYYDMSAMQAFYDELKNRIQSGGVLSAGTDLKIDNGVISVNTNGTIGNSADMSFVAGSGTYASGIGAAAFGIGTSAIGDGSHAEGYGYTFNMDKYYNIASGKGAHVEGRRSSAVNEAAHAEGEWTFANGVYSHAEGQGSSALELASHAEGISSKSFAIASHAEGATSIASGVYSHAEGAWSKAYGDYGSHAEGQNTSAVGEHSHSEGENTIASGIDSHSEGSNTLSVGTGAHAEGQNTSAVGTASHTEGYYSIASGDYSHAEGYETIAGSYDLIEGPHVQGEPVTDYSSYHTGCHAEGMNTTAYGNGSHAEGLNTYAGGIYQVEGDKYYTYNQAAHSEGSYTSAIGEASHAGGHNTIASGIYSFSHGIETSSIFYPKNGYQVGAPVSFGIKTVAVAEPYATVTYNAGTTSYSYTAHYDPISSVLSSWSAKASTLPYAISSWWGADGKARDSMFLNQSYTNSNSGELGWQWGGQAAFGIFTTAIGRGSFVAGKGNATFTPYSFVAGKGNAACEYGQTVVGVWNAPIRSQARFVVGAGTSDTNRKNSFYVTNGGATVNGDLIVTGNIINITSTKAILSSNTVADLTYTSINPRLEFWNNNASQKSYFIWTDYNDNEFTRATSSCLGSNGNTLLLSGNDGAAKTLFVTNNIKSEKILADIYNLGALNHHSTNGQWGYSRSWTSNSSKLEAVKLCSGSNSSNYWVVTMPYRKTLMASFDIQLPAGVGYMSSPKTWYFGLYSGASEHNFTAKSADYSRYAYVMPSTAGTQSVNITFFYTNNYATGGHTLYLYCIKPMDGPGSSAATWARMMSYNAVIF